MATNTFEFVKRDIFVSKEHYLAFRQAWKDHINERKGYLGGTEHLLFNILTEKDLSQTFRPANNADDESCSKRGFENAYWDLKRHGQKALEVVLYEKGEYEKPSYMTPDKYKKMMRGNRLMVEEFLEPFGKAVTVEMLAKLYLDYLKEKPLTNRPVANIEEKAA